ncbi:MAG: primase [Chthoniobacter sp.]|jgi:hypothetical protein|nr:primase [Chthoniobacter sp.]
MNRFTRDFILQVINATDIVAVIRGFVTLNKRGDRWVGLCPFHEEKSPSFGIKAADGVKIFKCFGCGAGGDAAKFLVMKEGISFPEAIRRLAAKAGVPMPEGQPNGEWKQKQPRRSAAELAAAMKQRKAKALALRASLSLGAIIDKFPWSSAAMRETSLPIPSVPIEEARAILRMFHADDIVWCGRFSHSIGSDDLVKAKADKPEWFGEVQRCFRPASEWLKESAMPGPRICPCAMKAGAMARSDGSVRARRFMVIEHDRLELAGQAAVLRWLMEAGGLKLRAVVFTGSKSLHGWFECPVAAELDEVKTVLSGVEGMAPRKAGESQVRANPGLGYDPQSFIPSQPFRLPGWSHDKTHKQVRLLFLK